MIPILYDKTETTFTSNGLGRLADCTSCRVTEERNGSYECEFSYPISGKHYADIEEGCFIACTHDDDGDVQPFEIYRRSAPINGIVTFNARHLSYRLSFVILNPFTANNISDTLTGLGTNAINTNPFTFWTDKTTIAPFTLSRPASVRSVMGGVEGSILDVYGGEWDFDKWTVKLWANRGMNSGVTIRYGKNLRNLEQTVDAGDAFNSVVPYWSKEEEGSVTLVTLPERIVSAPGVVDPVPVVLDMSSEFTEEPTENELRTAAQNYLDKNTPWLPSENIRVDFVQLWQTTEYAGVANLQKVRLCDTVNVYYPALGITLNDVKVIKVIYNVLADKYDEMELGQPSATFADAITADLSKQITRSQQVMEGFFDAAITTATEILSGNQGGHVVIKYDVDGKPQQILIMDTEDELTATNILRISMNGIGFSTNGGVSYDTAWTIDGQFVADFITSGTLKAIMIEGPTANTFWNLTTGVLQSYGAFQMSGTITPRSGSPTTVTYDIEEKTRLNNGAMTVEGKKTSPADAETTVFADMGLQASFIDYREYPQPTGDAGIYGPPSDLPNASLTFPHGGMIARGNKITSYGGDGDNLLATDLVDAVYRPMVRITPDTVELGKPENPTFSEAGTYAVDRNVLRLQGGWIPASEAIVFYKYTYVRSGSGGLRRDFFKTPFQVRPNWEIAPRDKILIPKLYTVGCLVNSKRDIAVSIPMARAFSEDVYMTNGVKIDGEIHARQGSTVLCNHVEFNSEEEGGYETHHYVTDIIVSKEYGLTFNIRHKDKNVSGTPDYWDTGTTYAMVFVTLENVLIQAYEDDQYPEPEE